MILKYHSFWWSYVLYIHISNPAVKRQKKEKDQTEATWLERETVSDTHRENKIIK